MTEHKITQEFLKSIFKYDPVTGDLKYLERNPAMFDDGKRHSREDICRRWNVRWSNKNTGYISPDGYVRTKIFNQLYLVHVVAWIYMTGETPVSDIDHIDRNKSNNAFSNLRISTESQNIANSKLHRDSTTGFKGVTKRKNQNKYRARIRYEGNLISLGDYDTPEEAHEAYCKAAKRLFGKFARFE